MLAVGNRLWGDDGAGVELGLALQARLRPNPQRAVFIAESAPESYSGPLRRFAPHLTLWLDVCGIGAPPGSLALLPWEAAVETRPGAHLGSPGLLARYLQAECGGDLLLLTFQPQEIAFDRPLTPVLAAAVARAAEELGEILEIER